MWTNDFLTQKTVPCPLRARKRNGRRQCERPEDRVGVQNSCLSFRRRTEQSMDTELLTTQRTSCRCRLLRESDPSSRGLHLYKAKLWATLRIQEQSSTSSTAWWTFQLFVKLCRKPVEILAVDVPVIMQFKIQQSKVHELSVPQIQFVDEFWTFLVWLGRRDSALFAVCGRRCCDHAATTSSWVTRCLRLSS